MKKIEVRVAALCVSEDTVLLVNHQKHGESYWVLPGGHVEKGESLVNALAREMKEELDLDVTVGALAIVHDFITDDRHVVNHVFRAHPDRTTLAVDTGKVLKAARWVSLDELATLDLRPAIAEHLRRLARSTADETVYIGSV